ncbi:DUF4272 domain-containing protein [Massilia cavernae]|uniref:DUF4272 domain-containing protein n=1 Tax=Massilia cavernae TaxID=2320864 RepID=A0A418Y7M4_9BURK|nr:DUF4272 domain-containing protein [Massilia cavernae]RJG27052.1 DUF4272 domain-containing protein [Massilia cavernae]
MFEKLKSLFAADKQPTLPEAPSGDTILFNAYCSRAEIPQPSFAHILHARRDLSDPGLLDQVNSLCGYVFERGDGQMSQSKYHVILHLQRVQHHVSIGVGAADVAALHAWARQANALLFTQDGAVLDPDGHVLVGAADGKPDAQARVPHPERAWARKAATEALLAARGIDVPATLPPLVCEDELVLRSRDEIIGRARALLLVALRAESVASGQPMGVEMLLSKMPLADDSLSPNEKAFLAKEAPSQQECAQFIWRYESLNVLEWVLGLAGELPFPGSQCDAAGTAAKLIEMRGPEVRGSSDILDALDLTYRLHWAIRQARLKKQGEPAGVDADVVMERHHALNWLVRFQHAGWDAIDTPT